MPDKIVLVAAGLLVGIASFVAAGAVASVLMSEVQQRATAARGLVTPGYAQARLDAETVVR